MASPPMFNVDLLTAMRDAALATAETQMKLATACSLALGEAAPTLAADKKTRKKKEPRDPNRPTYAETAYQMFMRETRESNTTLPKGKEAMRQIGVMWSQLSEAKKATYTQRAAKDRETYSKALEQYNRAKKSAAKDGAAGAVAAPAAEAPKKRKKRRDSEDGGERKKKKKSKKSKE